MSVAIASPPQLQLNHSQLSLSQLNLCSPARHGINYVLQEHNFSMYKGACNYHLRFLNSKPSNCARQKQI